VYRNIYTEDGLFVPVNDVRELLTLFRRLSSKDFFLEQATFAESGGEEVSTQEQLRAMCETDIMLSLGVWENVGALPAWPYGLVQMQRAAKVNEFEELADLITVLTDIAGLVLRTPQGAVRYLTGAALRYNTALLDQEARGTVGATQEGFTFPAESIPYLPRILGLEDVDVRA
jgi:hypothetical protein